MAAAPALASKLLHGGFRVKATNGGGGRDMEEGLVRAVETEQSTAEARERGQHQKAMGPGAGSLGPASYTHGPTSPV